MRVDRQIAISAFAHGRVLGITANRERVDFDERELQLFELFRPFLTTTMRTLFERARVDAALTALASAVGTPEAILFYSSLGTIEPADERSERWLADLLSETPRLPEELTELLRSAAVSQFDPSTERPADRLTVQRRAGQQVIRRIPGGPSRPAVLLVERAAGIPTAKQLVAMGLTQRQAEILLIVRTGASNATIARSLKISERTVAHHLEHVYDRLGVTTRTEAVRAVEDRLSNVR
jgi:DNA-binding NarL/FixJ family response regulator